MVPASCRTTTAPAATRSPSRTGMSMICASASRPVCCGLLRLSVKASALTSPCGVRQASQFCDLNAIGPVRHSACDLMEKYHVALPFPNLDGGVMKAVKPCRKGRQFMIVGGEQGAAAVALIQMLDRGPGNR